jgi:hypothetical protein
LGGVRCVEPHLAEVVKKELAAANQKALGPEALHAQDYMVYAHLQLGQENEAKRVLDEVRAGGAVDAGNHLAASYALAAIPARYALERHRWDEAARLEVPQVTGFSWSAFPQAEAVVHFAKGTGSRPHWRCGNSQSRRGAPEAAA